MMEKTLNKTEEMNENIKIEELNEEILDTVDGGFDPVTVGLTALIIAEVARFGQKVLCK